MSLFSSTHSSTLLAREIKINEKPNPGEFYFLVEGDETGLVNWVLKTLGMKDPSVSISITNKYITRIHGKKHYFVTPTSEIHNFDSGFAKNKKLLLVAVSLFMGGLVGFLTSLGDGEFLAGIGLLALLSMIAALFLWLYSRSGAMVVGLSTFNGSGDERMSIESGISGKKLDKNDFDQLFYALKNAVSENSKYFNR